RAMQFGKLVDIIFRSGDGKTEEKAFVVTDIADEYIISQILGENLGNYHRTSEMQTDGVYDIWKKPNGKKLVFKVIRGNQ
ncbi:MAG: DUF4919 domain-containing protein, partial [Bergeyella zoohelcum]|nr:DUF4919 domain-containing protein [Bergeyella zoohelcum]